MTVIRDKQNYSYPKPNSNTASDTESLHLGNISASDTESLNEEPQTTNQSHTHRQPVRLMHVEGLVNIKKSSGKRKLRRFQNRCVLHTLNEEEENENFIIVMESYKSPFTRLLEDPNALEFWNTFTEKSEEEQTKIIKAFSKKFYDDNLGNIDKVSKHGRLSSRIKRTIKIKKNLSLETVKTLEDDIIEFFNLTPHGVYIKFPPTSFDRLLLHAVAQYHKLKSISIMVEEIGKRSVEVHNIHTNWTPANCFLADFIGELRRRDTTDAVLASTC